MRSINVVLASLALGSASIALAQATAPAAPAAAPAATVAEQVKPGATVYDTTGAEAAKIDSIAGDLVVVSTGTNKISLPMASFAPGANGPVVSVTKAQIDAAATQANAAAQAALKAKLVAGTEVRGSGGAVVGKVKTVAEPNVVITTPTGDASLPMTAFTATGTGLQIGLTEAELTAAIAAAKTPA